MGDPAGRPYKMADEARLVPTHADEPPTFLTLSPATDH